MKIIDNFHFYQIEHYKTEYENEKKERERQEQMNRQLTRKLIDNENITFHFHSRVDHLERRLERQKFNTKREFTTCNCEQERNVSLQFLKNNHKNFTVYNYSLF